MQRITAVAGVLRRLELDLQTEPELERVWVMKRLANKGWLLAYSMDACRNLKQPLQADAEDLAEIAALAIRALILTEADGKRFKESDLPAEASAVSGGADAATIPKRLTDEEYNKLANELEATLKSSSHLVIITDNNITREVA